MEFTVWQVSIARKGVREQGRWAQGSASELFKRGWGRVCLYGMIVIRACYWRNQYPYALLWGLGKV